VAVSLGGRSQSGPLATSGVSFQDIREMVWPNSNQDFASIFNIRTFSDANVCISSIVAPKKPKRFAVDDFDYEIKVEFINESLGNLEESEGAFLELEELAQSGDPTPLLDRIFRLAHNLKGGSRAVGFADVATFTHELENLVLKIQKGGVPLNSDVVSTLLRSNDRLIEMLHGLKGDLNARFDCSDLIAEIQEWLSGPAPGAAREEGPTGSTTVLEDAFSSSHHEASPANEPVDTTTKESLGEAFGESAPIDLDSAPSAPDASAFFQTPIVEKPPQVEPAIVSQEMESSDAPEASAVALRDGVEAKAVVPAATGAASESNASRQNAADTEVIRVGLPKIDLLNDLVGELIVLQSVVVSQLETTASRKALSSVMAVSKIAKNIQEIAMGFRMLPVKPLTQKLQRTVRDTAKVVNKSVDFVVEGEAIEIDKSVLDRITDPLIHILRNGVDHGIEAPTQRLQHGKPEAGRIVLRFENEGNNLIVTVTDDGQGIDPVVVRNKALEKGLVRPDQSLSEKQTLNLILLPGFSTKATTSEISGRGVGMDVVKTNIEQIGGHVEISSEKGKGSCFRLQIPLSLSVIDGLVVKSATGRFVVPISQVEETVNLKGQQIVADRTGMLPCFDLRGQLVPLIDLDAAIENRPSKTISNQDQSTTALIINVEGRPAGLRVEEILRTQQIVIKPLSREFSHQKGWIGSCVLGDGLPTLILNPAELLSGRLRFELETSNAVSSNSRWGRSA
jgi:two-component system chemotaxis sensor kinase CheA